LDVVSVFNLRFVLWCVKRKKQKKLHDGQPALRIPSILSKLKDMSTPDFSPKAAAAALGLRHDFIAAKLGVHPSVYSRWVNNVRPIPTEHHGKMARILKVRRKQITAYSLKAGIDG